MKLKEQYLFPGHGKPLAKRVVIITGVMRSGTSILEKIVGSLKGMEVSYEPWPFMVIATLQNAGLMNRTIARMSLQKYCDDLLTDLLFGRSLNFRDGEISSILNYRTKKELENRWKLLRSRVDVSNFARKNKSILLIKATNMQLYYKFLYEALPGCKIIHMVRNGTQVAASNVDKGWYSNNGLKAPQFVKLTKDVFDTRSKRKYTVPSYLDQGEARHFHEASDFGRCALSWVSLMKANARLTESLKLKKSRQFHELKFEDLLTDPRGTVKQICNFLDTSRTPFTRKHLGTLDRTKLYRGGQFPIHELDRYTRSAFDKIMIHYGYNATPNKPVKRK